LEFLILLPPDINCRSSSQHAKQFYCYV